MKKIIIIYFLISFVVLIQRSNCLQLASEYDFREDLSQNYELEIRMVNSTIKKVRFRILKDYFKTVQVFIVTCNAFIAQYLTKKR